MPLVVASEGTGGPLEEILRKAGAVFGAHAGRLVALNYGSAAGELAACVHSVGLADHSATSKLELCSRPGQLDAELSRLVGRPLHPGEAVRAHEAWWCVAEPGRALVLCEPQVGNRLYESLHDQMLRRAGIEVRDRSDEWSVIELIGRKAWKVLHALGVFDELTDPPCFLHAPVAEIGVDWLLVSEHMALAVVDRGDVLATWQAIESVGSRFGLAYVGHEAATRYRLVEGAPRTL
jgi:glycine cleavage system aminomethyltransferase T